MKKICTAAKQIGNYRYLRMFLLVSVTQLLAFSVLNAQIRVAGIVRDNKQNVISGATVTLKGTKVGATTDVNGGYAITVPSSSSVLVFTNVGFTAKEEVVGNRSTVNVNLTENAADLENVVIIGYGGAAKKKDLTGATAQVGAKQIQERVPVTLMDALQGQAAGVLVTNDNGDPFGQGTIQIRGASTINAEGNGPLYVIDGVISEDGNFLNPADIETIDILKDASSAAIYGARGANGVILITTKKGKPGKPNINVNAYRLWGQLAHKLRTTSADELRYYRANRDNNSGYNADSTNPYLNADNDYQDLLFRTGVKQVVSVAVGGAGNGLNYYAGVNYTDDQSIVLNSWIKRLQGRVNLGYNIGKLAITHNLSFEYEKGNVIPVGNTVKQVFERNPWTSIYRPDGSYASYVESKRNPVAQALFNVDLDNNYTSQFNTTVGYEILRDLKFTALFNVQLDNDNNNQFSPSSLTSGGTGNATGSNTFEKVNRWQTQEYFNYSKRVGESQFTGTAGVSMEKRRWDYYTYAMKSYVTESFNTSNAGDIDLTKTYTDAKAWTLASFFTRLGYNYGSKYILQGTFRRDGSSRFGTENQYGNFFSGSAAWRFTQEKFLDWMRPVLFDGKFRFATGKTGNDAISEYAHYTLMTFGNYYNGINGAGINPTLGNERIQWETTYNNSYGMDLAFLKGKLNFSVDYYTKITKDLLYSDQLAKETGASSVPVNIGSITNKGWEFVVQGTPVTKKDFSWDVSANISFQDPRIKELANHSSFISGNIWLIREGGRIGDFYMWKNLGVFPYDASNAYTPEGLKLEARNVSADGKTADYYLGGKPYSGQITQLKRNGIVLQGGDTEWQDTNHDGIIDEADKVIVGNGLPDYFFGINNTVRYKNFSLNFLFTGQMGNEIFNLVRNQQNNTSSTYTPPIWDAVLTSWKQQGDLTKYPLFTRRDTRGSISSGYNSLYIEDGSFIRLTSMRLNYNLEQKWANAARLKNASVYVYGNNLLTWTNYTWYDPEFSSSGLNIGQDNGKYPKRREVGIGINVNF
jgi:TonB-dependent starch-binding outer membrane protein SusC